MQMAKSLTLSGTSAKITVNVVVTGKDLTKGELGHLTSNVTSSIMRGMSSLPYMGTDLADIKVK